MLESIYKKKKFIVNSVHHQGIKKLGKDLVVDAVCPEDQLIEAFHYKDIEKNVVIAVQWHPEFSHSIKDIVADPKPILDYFISRIK